MKAIQPYLDGIIEGAQSALDGLIDTIISTFWNTISPALSPLSSTEKLTLLLGITGLVIAGIQAYRQGYESRPAQPVALIAFVSVILVISSYLPSTVLKGVLAFVALAGVASAYNLTSYFAGRTEPSEWYDFYRLLFGSLTLAGILLILVLEYVVGLNLPLLP